MDSHDRFMASKWMKNRKWFTFAGFMMVVHAGLTFASIILVYTLFEPRYGFELWEQIVWTFVSVLNAVLCKWGQHKHVTWEIYLDGYERHYGLNSDYHEFVDDMKRQGKWPRSY